MDAWAPQCGKCKKKSREPFVGCEACRAWFHITCAGITNDEFILLEKSKNIIYWCNTCKINCEITDKKNKLNIESGIDNINLSISHLNNLFGESSLSSIFDKLKNEINDLVESKLIAFKSELDIFTSKVKPANTKLSYSEITKNVVPPVILKPKIGTQLSSKTKSDVLTQVDPVASNINFKNIQATKSGSLVIRCNNSDDSEKLKTLATEKLSDNYVIQDLPSLNPRVKIVGMSEIYEDNVFLNYLTKQNSSIFNNEFKCTLLNFAPSKRNNALYQATIQIDISTYDKLMQSGKVFIGYDYCSIFNAIQLRRCYNCCGFHHFARICSKTDPSCPKCAGKHQLKECKAEMNDLKCINCIRHNSMHKSNLTVNHDLWDLHCLIFLEAINKFKAGILGHD